MELSYRMLCCGSNHYRHRFIGILGSLVGIQLTTTCKDIYKHWFIGYCYLKWNRCEM